MGSRRTRDWKIVSQMMLIKKRYMVTYTPHVKIPGYVSLQIGFEAAGIEALVWGKGDVSTVLFFPKKTRNKRRNDE